MMPAPAQLNPDPWSMKRLSLLRRSHLTLAGQP